MLLFDVASRWVVRTRTYRRDAYRVRGKRQSMEGISVALAAAALLLAAGVFGVRRASMWQRGGAACASLACALASPVLMAAGSAPQWTRIVAVFAMFLAFCAVAAVVSPLGGTPDDDGTGGLRDGGWDPNLPDAPPGGTDDFQPDWWPEFEREFANYVAQPLPPLRPNVPAGALTPVVR